MNRDDVTLTDRFWERVERADDCWMWTGPTTKGYGMFRPSRTFRIRAHRFAWELSNGPIPEGLTIEHACHTADPSCLLVEDCPHRRCVRVEHLTLLTMRDNVLLSLTAPTAINARKTHCIRGHPLSGSNLVMDGLSRACQECKRTRDLARYHAGKKSRYAR